MRECACQEQFQALILPMKCEEKIFVLVNYFRENINRYYHSAVPFMQRQLDKHYKDNEEESISNQSSPCEQLTVTRMYYLHVCFITEINPLLLLNVIYIFLRGFKILEML